MFSDTGTYESNRRRHDQYPYVYHPKLGQHPGGGTSKGFPGGETKQAVAADRVAFIFSLLFLLLQTSRSADSLCSEHTFILIIGVTMNHCQRSFIIPII